MTARKLTGKDIVTLREACDLGLLSDVFKGRGIAFTGEMSMSREDMLALAGAIGARPMDAVKLGCSYLVVGDTKDWGKTSKIVKARRLGVTIITESEFNDMIKAPGVSDT